MYLGFRLFTLSMVVVSAACSRKRVEAATPAPTPSSPSVPVAAEGAPSDAASRDSLEREERLRAERERRIAERRAVLTAPVLFAYESAELSAEARQMIEAKLAILRETPELSLRLAGHADERGSDEFNLALGQRRAAAVRFLLVSYGIPEARLQAVSFGEEQPVCNDPAEDCWRRNRRVEFEVIAGGDRIVVR